MRIALLSLIVFFAAGAVHAQVFRYDLGKSVEATYKVDEVGYPLLQLTNITDSAVSYRWEQVLNEFPVEWDYSLCDNGACHVGVPFESSTMRMQPSETGFMKLTILAMGMKATGVIKFFVYPLNRRDLGDTLTFTVHMSDGVSGIAGTAQAQTLTAYPNPVSSGALQLSGLPADGKAQVEILNAAGQQVITTAETIRSGKLTVDISALPPSAYWIQVRNISGELSRTLFVKN